MKINKKQTRWKLFILCFLMVFFVGCQKGKAEVEPENSVLLEKENTSVQFSDFTNNLFLSEITSNTLGLHYTVAFPESFSITDYPITLGQCSEQYRKDSLQKFQSYKDSLLAISYDHLEEEDKITYDVMLWYFETELSSAPYDYYDEYLSPTLGVQAQLPILFAEYTFRTEKDITDYLTLLSQLDSYYAEIITYEQEKSAAGLFMPDFAVDDILAQCNSLISNTEQHFLITTFDQRIDGADFLTAEQKSQYIADNKTTVSEHFFPAYQFLIDGLTALKGTGTNDGGLCNYPTGKDYYSYLVKTSTGSDKTVPELIEAVSSQIQSDLTAMSTLLAEKPSLLEDIGSITIEESEPTESLEKLKQNISEIFPVPPDVNYEVKYVDPVLEKYLSPAFYLTPPIDNLAENVIYINQAFCNDSVQCFTTLAHEGYPGHLYQNTYAGSKELNKVRSLFSFSGYAEGYATYAETYAYDYLGLDPSVSGLLKLSNSVTLGLYAAIDMGIHYEGWTITETTAYLINYGIQDTDTISKIYRCIIEEPANYLKYYIGYLEILQLKEKAETSQGDDFSLKSFHDYLLSIGDSPFSVLEKYMQP